MRLFTLTQQSRWMPWARRGTIVSTVAVLAILLVVQIAPRVARLAELRQQQQATATELANCGAEIASLRPATQEGELGIDRLSMNLSHDPDAWMRRITTMSRENGLGAVTVQAGVLTQDGQVARLPMTLNFEGDYLDTCTFLKRVERLSAVTRVSTLHVHCTDLPTGQVEVQVALQMFWPEE